MRIAKLVLLLGLVFLWPAMNQSRAEVNVGLSIGDEGIKGFYLAIGEHYRVPEKEVVVVRERNIPDEELPVVFFLARETHVAPETIVKLRLGGKSWMDITLQLGRTAEMFYVPIVHDPGPPYGKAYGHYKKHDRHHWNEIRLADNDIVNFVNLKFICERYSCPPDDVIKLREKGRSFSTINTEVKKNRDQAGKSSQRLVTEEKTKDHDQGKGKGKKK
jgi:hypothetical protein